MIEILRSKRMTLLVAILITICTIIIIIEEWFTNTQTIPATSDLLKKKGQNSVKFANNFSIDVDFIDLRQSHVSQHTHWRSFLTFLSLTSFFGSLSGLLVRYRQQQLRFRTLTRFRSQKEPATSPAISSDDSCHALIDMSDHSY